MKFTILIPHFKTPKTTAYSVSQFLKFKGKHEVEIVVIDNSYPDKSIESLKPFEGQIEILHNTSDKISSHGIALDIAINLISNENVITAESDSFPTQDNWLDYYERIVNEGYDCAGSYLKLSGGSYLHPCGAYYKKSLWEEAKKYCDIIPYTYFPSMAMVDGLAMHTMVHESLLNSFLAEPEDYIELSESYKPYHPAMAERKAEHYRPVVNPFHNGMGARNENIRTYGMRTVDTERFNIIPDGKKKLLCRAGYEPGQWLHYYAASMSKKILHIPTEVFWMPGKENQQQQKTVMENGFTHIWCGTAFLDMKDTHQHDVYEAKKKVIDDLYESLPENLKIKI